MKSYLAGLLALGVVPVGCASNPPLAARAAAVERLQCDASSTAQEGLVRSTRVLAFEPIYSHIMTSRNNAEERVNGAKLLVRPPDGVSADELTRVLQCHGARVLLGQVNQDAVANDPYWLPDSFVQIEVKPEDGNFAILLSADSVHDGLAVVGRAHHYADEHMLATDPGLP